MDAKVLQEGDFTDQIAIVVGTRPGIIKMSPLIKEANRKDIDNIVIHAGQHYSYNLDEKFFEDLRIPAPDYKLEQVKECEYHGEQTAEMLAGIEEILIEEKPTVVLVCGDANYNLAGALAARKLNMVVGHVEAGLRSDDWRMPEEHNRVMIDHISEYLFAPTEETRENAEEDNVKGEIIVTGNTIVDAVHEHIEIAEKDSNILDELGVRPDQYFLFTAHREENVDDEENLRKIILVLERLDDQYDKDIIFSIHPRTVKMLEEFEMMERINGIEGLDIVEPVGYLDFLKLQSNSYVTVTDSGGIQEESCILGTPCVTLRDNTERPETVEVGANIVAGLETETVLDAIREMGGKEGNWENPFGDGTAAKKIIDVSATHIGQ
ncbi:MAG: UDP-N-acetylglucosamine 2-epimerase (non-hydrolyzing) [Halobacteriales archaeon]|nr:UDP-N-acetylglucosamine 2-epimerase (non-hydrolyzing) [Halobacteriales archaeon]